MSSVVLFLFIISVSGMAALFFKRRIEETIAVVIFSVITILYFGGMLSGSLLTGVYLCGIIGIGSVLYVGRKVVKDRRNVLKLCVTPGLAIFALLFIWIVWLNANRVFSSWDEFSHWGLAVKNMDYFDYFSNHPYSTDTFSGYPPATSLWQYFFVKLGGDFSESNVYCAGGGISSRLIFAGFKKT
ncbi:MAG: hypothetical protein NC123_06385 [Butyrivibrio sp.]|nr:hypothetical protein [Ruminococcus flavefaciens]MCM1559155.1 hypothetical protein [Butyrivibrio sp.]